MITEDRIREKLKEVKYPGFNRDIVSFGLIKQVWVEGDNVTVKVSLATRDPQIPDQIHREARAALESIEGIGQVHLEFDIKDPPQPAGGAGAQGLGTSSIPGIRKIVAVASGKGGVGKSTIAANLAVALSQTGASVGLCDCDLYGPSMALMFGSDEQLMANDRNEILPVEAHGLKVISMGFMLGDDAPAIVRGPLATRYTQQFLRQCAWGELDYLILDLPPGTGDIQLTIVQTVALDGAVVVTTPQEVALIDARKAVSMFQKVNVPILGIVENMAWFECEHGARYPIFGEGGGKAEAARLGVPLLAEIPIDIDTRARADAGTPVALLPAAENAISAAFHRLASSVAAAVER
ncbi:MAG: Mrp/NBP35 family ATP-binding protein [Verrucomicrobiales bacterium]|nr:Mrp/NBP35 family ATP-binding protein [Verrucomicrobiales bacterium]